MIVSSSMNATDRALDFSFGVGILIDIVDLKVIKRF